MKDNKNLNPIGELKAQLNTPKTETRIILEQEDLYPDLGYEDISTDRGYGPMRRVGKLMVEGAITRKLESDKQEKREQSLCIYPDCQNSAEIRDYCKFHKRVDSEIDW